MTTNVSILCTHNSARSVLGDAMLNHYCDSAAAEACAFWPGSPVRVHRGDADGSNAPGGDDVKRQAFELTRQAIGYRMLQLLELPLDRLGDAELQQALNDILQS
ncbi:protein tyrosine phosphatase [Caballeronia turbans]|jgi:arsenate reductase|nr:hypothetical protein [Caballeronia sp. INML2]SAL33985.1 protein tyrosine phosphatase [Caballeronia turbans]